MGQLTLRGLAPQAEEEIRQRARESGKSLNQVVLDIIHQSLGIGRREKSRPGEELRPLAGGWSEKEAEAIMAGVTECKQIDEEIWKSS